MPDYTTKCIDDMEAIYGGAFKRARAELGLTSFGFQVMDLPPNAGFYPQHDHNHDGQEELYVALRGGGEIVVDETERVAFDVDNLVRVGASSKRKIVPGDEGVRLLIFGGMPGKAYEPTAMTELGAPDPSLQ